MDREHFMNRHRSHEKPDTKPGHYNTKQNKHEQVFIRGHLHRMEVGRGEIKSNQTTIECPMPPISGYFVAAIRYP